MAHVPGGAPTNQSQGDVDTHPPHTNLYGSPWFFDPDDPFYLPPKSIPSKPGTIIRTQPATLPGDNTPLQRAKTTKILYTSTTVNGDAVATSGTVLEPDAPWTGKGPPPHPRLRPRHPRHGRRLRPLPRQPLPG